MKKTLSVAAIAAAALVASALTVVLSPVAASAATTNSIVSQDITLNDDGTCTIKFDYSIDTSTYTWWKAEVNTFDQYGVNQGRYSPLGAGNPSMGYGYGSADSGSVSYAGCGKPNTVAGRWWTYVVISYVDNHGVAQQSQSMTGYFNVSAGNVPQPPTTPAPSTQTCVTTCRGNIISPDNGQSIPWGNQTINVTVDYAGQPTGTYYVSYLKPGIASYGAYSTSYTAGQMQTQFTYPITKADKDGDYEVQVSACLKGGQCSGINTNAGYSDVKFNVPTPDNTLGCTFVTPENSAKYYNMTIGPNLVLDCTGVAPGQYMADLYFATNKQTQYFTVSEGTTTVTLPAPTFTSEGTYQMNSRPAGMAVQTAGIRQRFTAFQIVAGPHPPVGHYEYRTRTVTKVVRTTAKKTGSQGSKSHSTHCTTYSSVYRTGDVALDCWDGKYAQAIYTFKLPSGAYNVSRYYSGAAHCCSNGTTTKTWSHPYSTTYSLKVRVTGWHAYSVNYVTVTYSRKITTTERYQVWVCDAYCS